MSLFVPGSAGNSILILTVTAFLGLALGGLRIRGAGLGIAGALFAGLFLGHFGAHPNPAVMDFVKEFGLILFVYTIGMQVGPGFLDSLKRQGLSLNLLAAGIVVLGVALTLGIHLWGHVPLPAAVGILSGGTTNTPSLGAAQQALAGFSTSLPDAPQMAGIGYAIAYPFSVLGVILAMYAVRQFFRISPTDEAATFHRDFADRAHSVEGFSIVVENPVVAGKSIGELGKESGNELVITRLLREGHMKLPSSDDRVRLGDLLLAVGPRGSLNEFASLIGRRSEIDLRAHPGDIVTRELLVTRRSVLGESIGSLALYEKFGVILSRVTRGDFAFAGTPDIRLNFADRILVVGTEEDIRQAAERVGDSLKALDHPQLLAAFVGILIGVGVGAIPFGLPGVPAPVRLGLAGGPLVTAILLSRMGRLGPLNFYISRGANLMLRELGIVLFLSCVGLMSGEKFVDVLVNGPGLAWMGYGALITLAPLLLAGVAARKFLKLNYMSVCGLLSGAMTDPPALAFANTLASSDAPSVAYATVYPLTMILRVLSVQLLVLLMHP